MKKGLTQVAQMALWSAVILLIGILLYKYVVTPGTGSLPGEGLLTP